MARLPYLEKSDLAPEHQALLKRDISLYRQLVHSPGALAAFQGLGAYIRFESGLDARLRELAILQVGWLARAPYEWAHHIKIGYDFGVSDADIEGLIADSGGRPSALEPLARTVLLAAREMTQDQKVSDATFGRLDAALDKAHVVDLVVTIAFYNAVVRILATLEIDLEPDYRRYLDRHPLPAA